MGNTKEIEPKESIPSSEELVDDQNWQKLPPTGPKNDGADWIPEKVDW